MYLQYIYIITVIYIIKKHHNQNLNNNSVFLLKYTLHNAGLMFSTCTCTCTLYSIFLLPLSLAWNSSFLLLLFLPLLHSHLIFPPILPLPFPPLSPPPPPPPSCWFIRLCDYLVVSIQLANHLIQFLLNSFHRLQSNPVEMETIICRCLRKEKMRRIWMTLPIYHPLELLWVLYCTLYCMFVYCTNILYMYVRTCTYMYIRST